MLVIGVTGGIGSGKTEVCKMFAAHGASVLYTDLLARDIMETNDALIQKLKKAFGDAVFTPDGKLRRAHLAEIVFGNRTLKEKLDALVHPYVLKELEKSIQQHRSNGNVDLLIIEAALIFEAGADKLMDYILVVDADEETRIQRVMERDSATREVVERRLRAQMSPHLKAEKADFVIINNDDRMALETRVRFLHKLFRAILPSQMSSR